jgi:hypothetical protein
MAIEVRPEIAESERDALTLALRRLGLAGSRTHLAYASRWRRAGLETDGAPYAVARPRSKPGATRA